MSALPRVEHMTIASLDQLSKANVILMGAEEVRLEWNGLYHQWDASKSSGEVAAIALSLVESASLRSLELCGFPTELSVAFAVALKGNVSIQSLSLLQRTSSRGWRFELDDLSGLAIADALLHNDTLKAFRFEVWEITSTVGIALGEFMKHRQSLESFILDAEKAHSAVGLAFAQAVEHHGALKCFEFTSLCQEETDNDTYAAFAKALKLSHSMRAFTLISHCSARASRHGMTNATGVALADALRHHRTLESFKLHINDACCEHETELAVFTGIDGKTGAGFADALKHSRSLKAFELGLFAKRRGTDEVCTVLVTALKHNSSLDTFHIFTDASLSSESGLVLLDALREHSALKPLRLELDNHGRSNGKFAIADALKYRACISEYRGVLPLFRVRCKPDSLRQDVCAAFWEAIAPATHSTGSGDVWDEVTGLDEVMPCYKKLCAQQLSTMAGTSRRGDFPSLKFTERWLREKVLEFFRPSRCLESPSDFFASGDDFLWGSNVAVPTASADAAAGLPPTAAPAAAKGSPRQVTEDSAVHDAASRSLALAREPPESPLAASALPRWDGAALTPFMDPRTNRRYFWHARTGSVLFEDQLRQNGWQQYLDGDSKKLRWRHETSQDWFREESAASALSKQLLRDGWEHYLDGDIKKLCERSQDGFFQDSARFKELILQYERPQSFSAGKDSGGAHLGQGGLDDPSRTSFVHEHVRSVRQ